MLINNAGVMPVGPFLEQTEQAIRSAIEVNFCGVLTGADWCSPRWSTRRRGHIVNIASLAGMVAVPGQVVYAGTKFAVVGPLDRDGGRVRSPRRRGQRGDATVHQHRADQGTKRSRPTNPSNPRTIAAAIVKVFEQAEDPRVGARRRCASSWPSPTCWVRADGAGSTAAPGPTGCSSTSTSGARRSYEERAQAATGLVEPDDGSRQVSTPTDGRRRERTGRPAGHTPTSRACTGR